MRPPPKRLRWERESRSSSKPAMKSYKSRDTRQQGEDEKSRRGLQVTSRRCQRNGHEWDGTPGLSSAQMSWPNKAHDTVTSKLHSTTWYEPSFWASGQCIPSRNTELLGRLSVGAWQSEPAVGMKDAKRAGQSPARARAIHGAQDTQRVFNYCVLVTSRRWPVPGWSGGWAKQGPRHERVLAASDTQAT